MTGVKQFCRRALAPDAWGGWRGITHDSLVAAVLKRSLASSLAVIFSYVSISLSDAHAAEILWTNVAGGNWTAANNWSPNQVPTTNDNAWITNSGTYTVTIRANASAASLTAGASSGIQTIALTSGTLTIS